MSSRWSPSSSPPAYQKINLRLSLSDRNLHLIEDDVDIAVGIGALRDSSIVATRVGSMRTVVCASPRLLAGHGIPKSPEDLAGVPSVNFEFLSPAPTWPFRLKRAKGTTDVPIRPRLSVTTAEAAVWAAAQGMGVTRVLPYQCADATHDGSLRIILANFEVEPLRFLCFTSDPARVDDRTKREFAVDDPQRALAHYDFTEVIALCSKRVSKLQTSNDRLTAAKGPSAEDRRGYEG
jgi:DNA-binding transcriptional LysR family regulator